MPVVASQAQVEQEEAGETELVFLAARYTGDRSNLSPAGAMQSQGQWPGTSPLNAGVWYFALVPDEGLSYLESRTDLDVVYADDSERFAEILLGKPRLPPDIVGRDADPDVRDRLYDAMDLDEQLPPRDALEKYVDSEDVDGEVQEEASGGREQELVDEYTRDQLKEAVKEVRDDAEEFSLRGANKTDCAEYLVSKDEAEVAAALEADGDEGEGGS